MDERKAIEAAKSRDIVVVEEPGEGVSCIGFISDIGFGAAWTQGTLVYTVTGFEIDGPSAVVGYENTTVENIRPATLAEQIKFMDLSESMGVYQ
jgi:hypothetical protein